MNFFKDNFERFCFDFPMHFWKITSRIRYHHCQIQRVVTWIETNHSFQYQTYFELKLLHHKKAINISVYFTKPRRETIMLGCKTIKRQNLFKINNKDIRMTLTPSAPTHKMVEHTKKIKTIKMPKQPFCPSRL